jgi:hypothetical protein
MTTRTDRRRRQSRTARRLVAPIHAARAGFDRAIQPVTVQLVIDLGGDETVTRTIHIERDRWQRMRPGDRNAELYDELDAMIDTTVNGRWHIIDPADELPGARMDWEPDDAGQ